MPAVNRIAQSILPNVAGGKWQVISGGYWPCSPATCNLQPATPGIRGEVYGTNFVATTAKVATRLHQVNTKIQLSLFVCSCSYPIKKDKVIQNFAQNKNWHKSNESLTLLTNQPSHGHRQRKENGRRVSTAVFAIFFTRRLLSGSDNHQIQIHIHNLVQSYKPMPMYNTPTSLW